MLIWILLEDFQKRTLCDIRITLLSLHERLQNLYINIFVAKYNMKRQYSLYTCVKSVGKLKSSR